MKTTNKTVLAALLAALAVGPAFADKGGNGKGKHEGKHGGEHHAYVQRHDDDRGGKHARRYHDDHVRHDTRVMGNAGCPPGLAKKNNGCLPPGQAKKLAVGQPLPHGAYHGVPNNVLATLPPPPAGYRYAVYNNQVVLVSGSNIVVDILRSLIG